MDVWREVEDTKFIGVVWFWVNGEATIVLTLFSFGELIGAFPRFTLVAWITFGLVFSKTTVEKLFVWIIGDDIWLADCVLYSGVNWVIPAKVTLLETGILFN